MQASVTAKGGGGESPDVPETNFVSVDDIQQIYATQEFERQIIGRLQQRDIEKCDVFYADEESSERMLKAQQEAIALFPNPPNMRWKSSGVKRKDKKNVNLEHRYEMDMCIRAAKDCTPFKLHEEFLKDVCDSSFKIDTTFATIDNIEIFPGDEVWMEVSETPESLRDKLWQLQRTYLMLKRKPKAAIACINGESGKLKTAIQSINSARDSDSLVLQRWTILKDIPTFVIWTPYRNVYGTLQEFKGTLQEFKGTLQEFKDSQRNMEERLKNVEERLKNMEVGQEQIRELLLRALDKK